LNATQLLIKLYEQEDARFGVKYNVDGGTIDAIISGAAALAGMGWSIYDKKKNASQ
jgi:hypothetical protein